MGAEEKKARQIGRVYVLKQFLEERDTVEFKHNRATEILLKLDAIEAFTDPEVREFLDNIDKQIKGDREWCRLAWAGTPPPRDSDTWERVYAAMKARGDHGATGREVQKILNLGHGAVSGALSRWDQAGEAFRLVKRPVSPTSEWD